MLDSVDTIQEAIQLATQERAIHAEAGLEIRNWISSSSDVVANLGQNSTTNIVNLNSKIGENNEKVSCIWWCTKTDTITYSLNYNKVNQDVLHSKRSPTKREVLRTLISVIPHRFLASFVIYMKVLLREIWCSKMNWNDQITPAHQEKWPKWIKMLPKIEILQIRRCYSNS